MNEGFCKKKPEIPCVRFVKDISTKISLLSTCILKKYQLRSFYNKTDKVVLLKIPYDLRLSDQVSRRDLPRKERFRYASSLALSMLETSIKVQLVSRYHILSTKSSFYTIVRYEKANSFYRSKLSFFVQSSLEKNLE